MNLNTVRNILATALALNIPFNNFYVLNLDEAYDVIYTTGEPGAADRKWIHVFHATERSLGSMEINGTHPNTMLQDVIKLLLRGADYVYLSDRQAVENYLIDLGGPTSYPTTQHKHEEDPHKGYFDLLNKAAERLHQASEAMHITIEKIGSGTMEMDSDEYDAIFHELEDSYSTFTAMVTSVARLQFTQ